MCKHENKTCPRCHSIFECKPGDITKCQCYIVKLNEAERDFLAQSYNDCLCTACMLALRTAYNETRGTTRLKQFFGRR